MVIFNVVESQFLFFYFILSLRQLKSFVFTFNQKWELLFIAAVTS